MVQRIIPVVFAANDNYAPYLGVTMYSLIKHSSPNNKYMLYILSTDLNRHHTKRLLAMAAENVNIEIVDVSRDLEGINIPTIRHLSVETAYRLLIGHLFSRYEKVLYLDCDLVVNRDVAELFEIDLGSAIVGAALERLPVSVYNYLKHELEFPPRKYFNAGVLLINVHKFLNMRIGEKGLSMLSERNYSAQDQDVLNILCEDKVKYIDGRWNVEWAHIAGEGEEIIIDDVREGTLEYLNDPYILHFTSPVKPWAHPDNEMAEYFWEYARQTVFYEEILFKNIGGGRKTEDFTYYFPKGMVGPGSRIVIYGGGKVGKSYLRYLKDTGYCEVAAVCDRSPEKVTGVDARVVPLSGLQSIEYDAVVISIERSWIADEVRKTLTELGVPEDKIIWSDPCVSSTETRLKGNLKK